ncbi:MAG TPA: hypothetical protein VN893_01930 [Bryobacteraceae bacterium]|nr:hypothetical protein [Bryobacteraceae bacterium]
MAAAFLNIPDVRGEALDPQHLGWIEILSYSQTRGLAEFTLTKALDSTSPHLHHLALTGIQFDGELDAVNDGRVVLQFGLKGAVIAALQLGGRGPDGETLESLKLNCASVEVERR